MLGNLENRCVVIAEAGVNHNGDINLARKLIRVAAESGADYVKFQTFQASKLVTKTASKAKYQEIENSPESQFEMLKSLELSKEQHESLIAQCKIEGIKFLSTGFDIESLEMLLKLGIDLIKIPSGEITNYTYLQYIGKLGKHVILSTGMSNLKEIEEALEVLEDSGLLREQITILHCTTNYPASMDEVNLRAMSTIREEFKCAVGYSDHTLGSEVALGAIALGAKVIEKHFTLDKDLPGPDHKASLNPSELTDFVSRIRNLEVAMGSFVKGPSESEKDNMKVARRSIVASQPIAQGEIFTKLNLEAKRPGTGISPMKLPFVLGKQAVRAFETDELIELE
ncbi:SpsE Sialic acid synthase [Candidatus Nanopelagicaceae bacterium]